uniref:Uncharacterized protein n=1 Tax=Glossina brevipalpis TaxID=37001 RepID=A0A1A9WS22_9MUSC
MASSSSSSICTHFSQNAWKKDLCSNCFKSKDEHKQSAALTTTAKFICVSTNTSSNSNSSNTSNNNSTLHSQFCPKTEKTDYPNKHKMPAKSCIKKSKLSNNKHKSHKVCFPKSLSEVIGYGGEWSDDSDDDHDFMNLANDGEDDKISVSDDEETVELKRITRANTDFNMNNGNLLGDPQENIKKSFAALKLGAPQVDKEGKKQTLQINVTPFGSNSPNSNQTSIKTKFETKTSDVKIIPASINPSTTCNSNTSSRLSSVNSCTSLPTSTLTSNSPSPISLESSDTDGTNSPPIERAMEKSLLDEISETLEKNQNEAKNVSSNNSSNSTTATSGTKIKFEITSLSDSTENKTFLDLKKPIVRNTPITKDQIKPKVNVFHKYSDTESINSDNENGVSAYYDVVESQTSYENLPDGKCAIKEDSSIVLKKLSDSSTDVPNPIYTTSQYITDMLLSSKTRAASYNLHEGNFMTSKITSDGLIVTKCTSDDALDSTGSSFDGSSDEETSYNIIRSESDSGIGISLTNEYKNVAIVEKDRNSADQSVEKKLSASTNNSDYEDIQITEQKSIITVKDNDIAEKSRELHGEPDGSADPDGSLEQKTETETQKLPALPKSPPPTNVMDARPTFLNRFQKNQSNLLMKKPELPAKPAVTAAQTPLKAFIAKKPEQQPQQQQQQQQHQVISQLQTTTTKSQENLNSSDCLKEEFKLKKGKAPNPPPETKSSPISSSISEKDYSTEIEIVEREKRELTKLTEETETNKTDLQHRAANHHPSHSIREENPSNLSPSSSSSKISSSIYARKFTASTTVSSGANNCGTVSRAMAAHVLKEKDKRERATINPKFRSLNTFVTQRNNAIKNSQLQNAVSPINVKHSLTPEPSPRNPKNLSMSEECLIESTGQPVTNSISVTNLTVATANNNVEKTKTTNPVIKTKTKFSIKKFLRMGGGNNNKTPSENLSKHHKEGIYSEICTGEEANVAGKPRLVIIHPIDINPTAVEVVRDITKTNDAVTTQTVAVVTSKPPAPPLRSTDGQRAHDINKPARPPPPKSAELRRKQKSTLTTTLANSDMTTDSKIGSPNIRITGDPTANGSIKSKSDNVYANLGEIRSSIAPRKPERTASMREREAQLELARKRHIGGVCTIDGGMSQTKDNCDTISICSSNEENVSTIIPVEQQQQLQQQLQQQQQQQHQQQTSTNLNDSNKPNSFNKSTFNLQMNMKRVDEKPPSGSGRTSTFERKKNEAKINISNKLEIFDNLVNAANIASPTFCNGLENCPSSIKDSVRKITSTIDSYLKDKRNYENMYECVKDLHAPPPPPARSNELQANQRLIQQTTRRNNLYADTISLASYTRSEYGPVRNYGLNNSLANLPRMISSSYCSSEMGDLDIYSPYSYYGSETGGDIVSDINDSVWGMPTTSKNRTKAVNRLRMRKGRSVMHKTIEDNYSAVVGANHEALAQVLEQLQQTPIIPPALRPLANAINLRFEDFTILEGAQAFVVGKKAFHAAVWATASVTLALSADCNQLAGIGGELNQLSGGISGALNPITEFCDLVPSYHLPLMPSTEVTLLQATISVLPRLQLDTLQSIGTILKGKSQVLDKSNYNFRGSIPNLTVSKESPINNTNAIRNGISVQNLTTLNEEGGSCVGDKINPEQQTNDSNVPSNLNGMPAFDDIMTREVAFIMLQLINGMKNLQIKAIEEMPLSLSNVVLSKEVDNKDSQARLCVLQGNNHQEEDEPTGTLCKCAHIALTEMLPSTKISNVIADILLQERSESLSKSKSVLEFILWGPSDVALTGSTKERELALQRWLDLERATVLHGLVRTRVELTVYDECHLMFLVRSTAKIMNDAAKIMNSY